MKNHPMPPPPPPPKKEETKEGEKGAEPAAPAF